MDMKHLFFVTTLLFISINLMAQTTGSVSVYKDPRIDILLKKQAEVNDLSTRNSAKRRSANGFRLLVVSAINRNDAIAARTKVLMNFPELKAYMFHQAPYFKVTAGNFLNRNDALAYQKKMTPFFPSGVFVINAVIEVKPEEAEAKEQ
jgi:hypothetical protein